jgi:diguanylate cyclase (GGDEF)-like protein
MEAAAKRFHRGLSAPAAAFEFVVVWGTVAAAAVVGSPERVSRSDWIAFAILVPLCAVVHLLASERSHHQGSQLSLAPMFTAALLLPPALAAIVIAVAWVPDWLRSRVSWYIVVFNVANFVGPALAARVVFDQITDASASSWTVGALAGIATFLVLQYGTLAIMLRLARGVSIRDTLRIDNVLIDAGLLSLGALGAALAARHPSLVLLLLLPLGLMYRSLSIPSLVEASRVEPKTGLFNMRHFSAALEQELRRAERFERPLSLLMIDVDHLREINNTLGHVVGDRCLQIVAASLRAATRDYDVSARFGGDEFCVLLPETGEDGALTVAERVRATVERMGAEQKMQLTVSVGVASVAGLGTEPNAADLLALADRAAYRAKFSGRNAVATAPVGDPVVEAERLLADSAD